MALLHRLRQLPDHTIPLTLSKIPPWVEIVNPKDYLDPDGPNFWDMQNALLVVDRFLHSSITNNGFGVVLLPMANYYEMLVRDVMITDWLYALYLRATKS